MPLCGVVSGTLHVHPLLYELDVAHEAEQRPALGHRYCKVDVTAAWIEIRMVILRDLEAQDFILR